MSVNVLYRTSARAIPGCLMQASGLQLDDVRRLQREVTALRQALEGQAG